MRNRLKIFFKGISISMLIFMSMSGSFTVSADKHKNANAAEVRNETLDNMSFIEMLSSVELDPKSSSLIQKLQEKEGRNRLHNGKFNSSSGCSVETYRNKEVLVLTIPASKLFAPNETELREGSEEFLKPIRRYLKDPDMYRVLIVMHTDNTGSELYRDILTDERASAVFDWFVESGADTRYLFSYSLSDEMPLVPNNSIQNREKNRRLEIILEPGSAFTWQTGDLVTTVLDVVEDAGIKTAIIDASFACHMPDTLEMPYKPYIEESLSDDEENGIPYRLGGNSCLSGDFVGDWKFASPLQEGDKLTLKDMNHYTTVKTNMFNGIQHPSIWFKTLDGEYKLLRKFSYDDYKNRMD